MHVIDDVYGRTKRVERSERGQLVGRNVYRYDSTTGLLTSVEHQDAVGNLQAMERYTYDPKGQLLQYTSESLDGTRATVQRDYDSAVQLAGEETCDARGCRRATFQRDDQGRVVQQVTTTGSEQYIGLEQEDFTFDSQGRRVLHFWAEEGHLLAPDFTRVHKRVTRRAVYSCEVGALLLEESDSDEDGVVDGARTLERDSQGRLVREVYSGSAVTATLERRELRYDCP